MNISYIISAYKRPSLLVRLVERIDTAGSPIFIHVDARTGEAVYRAMADPLSERPNVHFLPRHPCHWGDFGHVAATLKGLRALLASRLPFDYLVLLTGQDYPLRSNEEIRSTLADGAGRVFLDCMPIPNPYWTEGGSYRIEDWHFRLRDRIVSFPGAPFRNGGLNGVWRRTAGLLRLHREFPLAMRPYGGSSYWIIPAECARYIDAFVQSNPSFVAFFQHVHVPDEIFFQTIVMNSPFRDRVADDDLRYVDWEPDGDGPKVLTAADFDRLIRSGKLFARKFDPEVDSEVLDRIDGILAHAGTAGDG